MSQARWRGWTRRHARPAPSSRDARLAEGDDELGAVARRQQRQQAAQQRGERIGRHLAADLAELETLMDLMTTRARGFEWPAHPIFGRMSRGAWLRWAYLHMDHHLRQFGA